jgi:lysophospholipase L1-like esterase
MHRRIFFKTTLAISGIGGNNTVDLLKRIDKDCLNYKPDLTILMVGTNDMNSRKHIPLPQYETNVREIIEKVQKVGSKILLMNVLPVYETYLYMRHPKSFYAEEDHRSRLIKVNKLLLKLSQEYSLAFLDIFHVFDTVGSIGESAESLIKNELNSNKQDGVHPTPNGYRTMAIAIYEKLIASNLPHERIVCFGDSITHGDGLYENSYPGYLKKLLGY